MLSWITEHLPTQFISTGVIDAILNDILVMVLPGKGICKALNGIVKIDNVTCLKQT